MSGAAFRRFIQRLSALCLMAIGQDLVVALLAFMTAALVAATIWSSWP